MASSSRGTSRQETLDAISLFSNSSVQVESSVWEFIRTFDGPIGLAKRCIEWAKQNAVSTLTASLCEVAVFDIGTQAEQTAMIKRELENKTLQEFINSAATLNVIDPKAICRRIEKLWKNGVLPLHEFDARYYIEFLSNKEIQRLYK